MVQRFLKKLGYSAAGVVIALIWFSLTGGASGENLEHVDRTPEVAMGGGAGVLDIEFEINQPAVLKTTFSRWDEATDEEHGIDAAESFEPGKHRRVIDVGPDLYLYVELGVPDATVGAELKWTIRLDGVPVTTEAERLTEPLGRNYAFFLQLETDGVEEIRDWLEMQKPR